MTASRATVSEVAETAYFSAYLTAQRSEADDQAYETALKDFLKHLQARRDAPHRMYSDDIYVLDLTLAHVRLAALAMKRGAKDEADAHLEKAVALCSKLRWRDCSATNMLDAVRRFDEKTSLAPKTTE